MLVLFCMRGRGRIARPAFPAPSDGRERDVTSNTRAKTCGEIAKPCLYAAGCLKSEAVAPKPRPSLRGACHRARIRATRWLATTLSKLPRRDREAVCRHCEERKRRSNPLFLCSARWIASSLLGKMDCFASLAMTLSKLPRRDREAGLPSLRGAEATKQSTLSLLGKMDCFAEPVIGRAFARPVGSQ